MKQSFLSILALIFILSFGKISALYAQVKKEKEPTTQELASREAERLGELLKLQDWQVFYVDSTLQHDYEAMKKEIESLQKSKVEKYDLYILTQDRWMEKIDSSYQKYFNASQWKAYLKSGAAKAQKARAKRKAKMNKK